MEDISIIKFQDFEVDIDKTRSLFGLFENIITLFNSINFKNYKIGGSLALALKTKKLYKTPGDLDIVIENEYDLKYIIDLLLSKGFSLDEAKRLDHIDEFEFKRTFLERERFCERIKNEHFFESIYAPCYTSYRGDRFAQDFRGLDKINYYLLHDPRRSGYLNLDNNLIKINFRYKNTIQNLDCEDKNDLILKINLNNYTSTFGFLYYTTDGENPNGRYGKPLNKSTEVVKCLIEKADGYGGCFYSSEPISKDLYSEDFKYKLSIYKNCATIHLFDQEHKLKIGIILSKDEGDFVKYKNIIVPIVKAENVLTNKYFRRKDLIDFDFFDLKAYLQKSFWEKKSDEEINKYLKSIYSLADEEADPNLNKVFRLIKNPMSTWSKAFYRHKDDL